MDSNVIKANIALGKAIIDLQGQMAIMDKKLKLCLQIISEFGHMVPQLVDGLEAELEKLDEGGVVKGNTEVDTDTEEDGNPRYANLKIDDLT